MVWACGAWLATLFGELVTPAITRQELLFLRGGPAWGAPEVPAWVDYDRAMYGTADIDGLGVKLAFDSEGPPQEADAELSADVTTEDQVRAYARDRFPALADAPLASARACRYELSSDWNFSAAPHPEHPGVWLVGGGSGHGFKHDRIGVLGQVPAWIEVAGVTLVVAGVAVDRDQTLVANEGS